MSGVAIVLLLAGAAELHPVPDRPYRYDTVETRGDGTTSDRYVMHRTVIFHRDGAGGWIADVTLDSVERPEGDVGTMFAAANAGLLHRTIRFRLDAGGKISSVDDIDAVWAALVNGMATMGGSKARDAGPPASAQAMAIPLRALPPERRQTMLASIVKPLLAPAAAGQADGTHAVTLPARPPAPPGATLAGVESVSHATNGTVTIKVEGSTPSDNAMPATPRMISTSIRNIDPATGLLEDARDISDVSIIVPTGRRRIVTETHVTLLLAP